MKRGANKIPIWLLGVIIGIFIILSFLAGLRLSQTSSQQVNVSSQEQSSYFETQIKLLEQILERKETYINYLEQEATKYDIPLQQESTSSLWHEAVITRFIPNFCGSSILSRINTKRYLYYKNLAHPIGHDMMNGEVVYTELGADNFKEYVTASDLKIQSISQKILDDCKPKNDEEKANKVLEYVHKYVYEEDIDNYAKYPIETLAEGSGDCEDLSVLAASLMKSLDLDVALVIFSNHVGIGISLPSEPSVTTTHITYFEKDGKKYYYGECTGTDWPDDPVKWKIGEKPSNINYTEAYVLPV